MASSDKHLQKMTTIAEAIRKQIADAEAADKPFARDPLVQAIKAFTNDIDRLVAQKKQKSG